FCIFDYLDEAYFFDPISRALHLRVAELIALDYLKRATDHLIERADIAHDVDPLDVDLRPLLDIERYVYRVIFAVAYDIRLDLDKRLAPVTNRIRQNAD